MTLKWLGIFTVTFFITSGSVFAQTDRCAKYGFIDKPPKTIDGCQSAVKAWCDCICTPACSKTIYEKCLMTNSPDCQDAQRAARWQAEGLFSQPSSVPQEGAN